MIGFQSKGSFKNTEAFLAKMARNDVISQLDKYGAMGVAVLSSATPVETGLTAGSWYYEIVRKGKQYSVVWRNSHTVGGGDLPIAILLHYGHGTGTGGYVQGRDFINPAIRPVFDQIAADIWRVVTSA
jgi:hypothetical protein